MVHPARVLLDLSGVVFLDQFGLDALLNLQNLIENGRGTVELLDSTPDVLRLLHETHLNGKSRRGAR